MTDPAKPTILAIVSQSFNSDLAALIQRGTRFQWILQTDDQLMKAQASWVPERARIQS